LPGSNPLDPDGGGDNLSPTGGSSGLDGGATAAIVILTLLVVICGAAAIYWGHKYQKKQIPNQYENAVPVKEVSSDAVQVQIKKDDAPPTPSTAPQQAVKPAPMIKVVSEDPEADHKESKARLRQYEIEYEAKHGKKPRNRPVWGEMWPEYEKYAQLREMRKTAEQKNAAANVAPASAEEATMSEAELQTEEPLAVAGSTSD